MLKVAGNIVKCERRIVNKYEIPVLWGLGPGVVPLKLLSPHH